MEKMQWRVIVNGRFNGIIETNWEYACKYWGEYSARTGRRVVLKRVQPK